jgi:heparan-alpha-glucosaminide N-acetyltransferase
MRFMIASSSTELVRESPNRILSVDALRGFVMFMMIFVNDLAGAPATIVPPWMRHFHGKSGMTFVDLVFPAFLFIVGMSIPLALGRRVEREPLAKTILHIISRTLSLLLIGIMMVNESPNAGAMGWSPTLWSVLLYGAAILAFCSITPKSRELNSASAGRWRALSLILRVLSFATLAFLAFSFRGEHGERIITLSPLAIRTEWYGILGLIGWAYLVASVVFLVFREHRTAILGCVVLLLCLYPADRSGAFNSFWLAKYVGIGGTLGSQGSISVAGLLLGSILVAPDMGTFRSRLTFTLLFIAGFAAAALLTQGLYGIYKNSATPSWCLWSCAITATLWLGFYLVCDLREVPAVARPLAFAGANVLLAYLLSEMLPSALDLVGLGRWYDHIGQLGLSYAIARSAACGVLILALATGLNRLGFRIKI